MCHYTPIIWIHPQEKTHNGSLNQAQMEDQSIGQDASFIEVATQAVSATASGVNMTSPIILAQSDGGEVVCAGGDCFNKKIEPRDDWCHPWGQCDHPAQWQCFPESPYDGCSLRKDDQQ